jgi:predicted porin
MKKTLLAAALLAGFAGVAQAETQVTLYGIIDTGIDYGKYTRADGVSINHFGLTQGSQSGSRWGLKGTEELGDGLKAIFQLESGFDSSNGYSAQGGRLFGRQAWAGLANASWGQVEFGRIYSAPTSLLAPLDPFTQGWGLANLGTTFSAFDTERLDNGILYLSPVFSGFQFGANYSFNTGDTGANAIKDATAHTTREIALAATYTNGPLFVGASYSQLNEPSNSPTLSGVTPREEIIGATYDFQVVKVHAGYSHTSDGWFVGNTATLDNDQTYLINNKTVQGLKANAYFLGATVPIGAVTKVFASWQHATISGYDPGLYINPSSTYVNTLAPENIFSLGATYSLSKRTNLYAVAAYDKNYAGVAGQKATDVIVGIRHQF